MRRDLYEALLVHRPSLVEQVDLDNGLLTRLAAKKVLTPRQIRLVQAEVTVDLKVEKLLDILARRPDETYQLLCEALIENDQVDVVDQYLRPVQNLVQADTGNTPHGTKRQLEPCDENNGTERKRQTGTGSTHNDEQDSPDCFQVVVQKCTRAFYETHKKQAYPMDSVCRGRVVIFNVSRVAGLPDRSGTNVDRDNLAELFKQLHFSVQVYNDTDDLTAQGMLHKLSQLSQNSTLLSAQCLALYVYSQGMLHKLSHLSQDSSLLSAQCLVLCVLTHGTQRDGVDVLYGTDGRTVNTRCLLQPLSDARCPYLHGTPRLVFMQACRGDNPGSVVDDEVDCKPELSNFLIAYPTQDGYQAWRNRTAGSWYMHCLVRVVMENAYTDNICTLLHKVNDMLKRTLATRRQITQTSMYESHLNRDLYFFPGIHV